ncbi:MAG: hypothetical protein ACO1N8_10945 [Methylophilus sp.]
MSKESILLNFIDMLRKQASKIPSGVIGNTHRLKSTINQLEKLTDPKEIELLAKIQSIAADETKVFETADNGIRAILKIEEPAIAALTLISTSRELKFHSFASRFSQADSINLASEISISLRNAIRSSLTDAAHFLKKGVADGYVYGIAGAIREIHGRNLEAIAKSVRKLHIELGALRYKTKTKLELVDSMLHGTVQLPTSYRMGNRNIGLGPDRIIGYGERAIGETGLVDVVASTGETVKMKVAGVFNPKAVVEVKGRSNALGGLSQFIRLQRRSSREYMIIGDELWLLGEFNPKEIKYFLVAPEGEELAKAIKEVEAHKRIGYDIDVIAIPKATDNAMIDVARKMVNSVLSDAKMP